MKLKLKPSARMNRRYLLLNGKDKNKIENSILEYIGILGWAKASPVFIDDGGRTILSVDRKEVNNIRAAFEASTDNVKILRISGTIKGLSK
ncbi:MAG: hypothetical protein AABW65_02780 [Nanoarchaeota archaeon]